jgi:type II secretion system protein H
MRRRAGQRGFTLLELVLVLVIISAALAMVAPALRGWNRGSRLYDTATEFAAAARWARTQAISTGRVHRLRVDPATASYWVMSQRGEEFVDEDLDLGRLTTLPEGFAIELTGQQGKPIEYVEFDPAGGTQPAQARIESDQGKWLLVQCLSPADRFRVVREWEQSR